MRMPTRQHIYIFDHPESKIRFLETTLAGDDWMATIVIPPRLTANPQAYAATLEREFRDHGFTAERTMEGDGTVNLTLHHFSSHTAPVEAFRERGLVKGAAFTLENIGPNLTSLLSQAGKTVEYLVKEPARLFSTIYLLGDMSYSLSGWFQAKKPAAASLPKGNWLDGTIKGLKDFAKPENALMSVAGWFALLQSLTVMKFANNGGELNYNELKTKFKSGEQAGIDGMNVKGWTAPELGAPVFGLGDLARKYPIDAGSWAQIMGQVALMGASAIQIGKNTAGRRELPHSEWWKALRDKNPANASIAATKESLGSGINIARALISITAWSMLMRPAKDGPIDADWSHPITRLQQEIDHHPERAAGFINGIASVIGLTASRIKGNKAAISAEALWLIGDVVMMFAKKDHYGERAAQREIPLIDAATRFLKEMPVAVSESRKSAMVNDLAQYLAQKTVDDKTTTAQARTAPISEEIETLKQAIVAGVNANLSMVNHVFDRMSAAAAILIERFPPEERAPVIARLAKGLAASPGIYASEEEIIDSITHRVDMKAGYGIDKPNMSVLARDIAQLVVSSPPIANAGVATAVYDAVMPAMQTGPHDTLLLDRAMSVAREQAAQETGAAPEPATHASRVQQSHGTQVTAQL